jgi:tetratricopeptide (TPR) repeat protein
MKNKISVFAVAMLLTSTAGFAQGSKGAPPASSNPGSSVTPADPSKYMNRDWNKLLKSGRAGDELIGNVEITGVPGGALPWDPVRISVTCEGKTSYTTNTDPKGYFLIARTEAQGSTTLKADQKSPAQQFAGCAVEAALPGFNAEPLTIGNRNVLDSPSIGTIKMQREAGSGDASLSSTSAGASKDAVKSYEKARGEWQENKPDKAQKDLQKAVEAYPQYAEAWYQLGKLQEAAKSADAWNSFAKAVAADPKFALPHEHMASLAAQAGKWQDALDETNKELELNPRGTIDIWYYSALGNYQLKKEDAALASAQKSLAMDPLHLEQNTEQLLAVILVDKQDYAGALQHLKNCATYFTPGPNLDLVKQQIAQLQGAVPAQK